MCGATFGRFAIPSNCRNVSADVLLRCAVQMTLRPGSSRHSAKMMHAIRYVLPTWRGMLMTTVSEAYEPSDRFAKISLPAPSCQPSKCQPRRRHVSNTFGHDVEAMPSGVMTWRATSESRRWSVAGAVEGFVVSVGDNRMVLILGDHDGLDLAADLKLTARQGGKVASRRVRVVDRAGQTTTRTRRLAT